MGAPGPEAKRRQSSSLPSRIVTLVGLSFFTVEVVVLVVFAGFYWAILRTEREDDLVRYTSAVRDPVRRALLEEGVDEATLDADLDAALRGGAQPGSAPDVGWLVPPADASQFRVWVFTPEGALRYTPAGQLEARAWAGARPAAVEAVLAGDELAARHFETSSAMAAVEPIASGGDGPPAGALYVETPLRGLQREVALFGLVAFGTGAIALFFTALVTIGYLRRALLHPLSLLIRADNAARRGEHEAAVVDEGDIPDDEVGTIMRSRNHLFVNLLRAQRDLDDKNRELEKQREELRRWGQELERLVREKTDALLGARDRLHQTQKLAALGRLAANVAHEINNPLACIAGYAEEARAELASGGWGPAEVGPALETIEGQAFRCKEILDRLLGLVRADRLEVTEVELGDLVRSTAALCEPGARKRGVALRVDAAGPGPVVATDPGYLQQVILNLVENAVDAAERQGADGWVALGARAGEDGAALLTVSDSGQGIPPDVREQIFDPYVTTKPVGRGTGLGLAICQTLVERLGGSIAVAPSEPGAGATFCVRLPLASSAAGGAAGGVVTHAAFMEAHTASSPGGGDPDA